MTNTPFQSLRARPLPHEGRETTPVAGAAPAPAFADLACRAAP